VLSKHSQPVALPQPVLLERVQPHRARRTSVDEPEQVHRGGVRVVRVDVVPDEQPLLLDEDLAPDPVVLRPLLVVEDRAAQPVRAGCARRLRR
jgi:hypothetical protein